MRHNNRHISRKTTPWDDKSDKTPVQEFLIQHYQQHYEDKHQPLKDTGEVELINLFVPKACPHCSGPDFRKHGVTKNGVQRYQCIPCKKTFSPVTNTIFEGHKISISEWIEYTLNLLRYISITADSWNNRNAFKDHIMSESVLVHDKDAAHSLLISDLNLKSESYDSKVIKKLQDKDNTKGHPLIGCPVAHWRTIKTNKLPIGI